VLNANRIIGDTRGAAGLWLRHNGGANTGIEQRDCLVVPIRSLIPFAPLIYIVGKLMLEAGIYRV
jgi:hypothetical protein